MSWSQSVKMYTTLLTLIVGIAAGIAAGSPSGRAGISVLLVFNFIVGHLLTYWRPNGSGLDWAAIKGKVKEKMQGKFYTMFRKASTRIKKIKKTPSPKSPFPASQFALGTAHVHQRQHMPSSSQPAVAL